MANEVEISGPFGKYPWGSLGATLNSAHAQGVPLRIVENLRHGMGNELKYGSDPACLFEWIEGVDTALFLWISDKLQVYNEQHAVIDTEKKVLKPEFRLTLCAHRNPALEVRGRLATPELHAFLHGMLTNRMEDPRYKIHQAAGAFFQGGAHKPDGNWVLIEFWKPKGAQAFVDYVNEHFEYPIEDSNDEKETTTSTD